MLLLMDVLSVSTKNTALSNKVKQAGYPISCLFFYFYLHKLVLRIRFFTTAKHFLYVKLSKRRGRICM